MTDSSETQQVLYFGTPVGVAGMNRMRRLRAIIGREHAVRVLGWYVQMRDLAKQGTTFATFSTSVEGFAESMYEPIPTGDEFDAWFEERAALWDSFDEADLVEIEGETRDRYDGFRVSVVDFDQTNLMRATRATRVVSCPLSNAERQAVKRENKKRQKSGLSKMSDEQRDSWLATRRDTKNDTTRHDTPMGWDVLNSPSGESEPQRVASVSPPAIQEPEAFAINVAVAKAHAHIDLPEFDQQNSLNGNGSKRLADLDAYAKRAEAAAGMHANGRDLPTEAHPQGHAQDAATTNEGAAA